MFFLVQRGYRQAKDIFNSISVTRIGDVQDYTQKITAHWALINRIAGRRFADAGLAEEAALYVINGLEQDNCRRMQGFSGRARLSTFIASISLRLLEDFSRKKFGRVRPPAWITALGGIWVMLFELLCLQRLSVVEAVETLMNRVASGHRQQVEESAWTVLERVTNCGAHQGLEVSLDNTESGKQKEVPDQQYDPEILLLAEERKILFRLLFQHLAAEEGDAPDTEKSLSAMLQTPITMSAEERLLLKLCFQDELSVTRAGKMLGLNANQAHGKLRRLLARLRDDFERAGISDELRAMLHGGE